MASIETKILDNYIASRRSLLVAGGAAALAAVVMPNSASAALTVSTVSDAAILNFALNLEYLEANYYYLAAFGTTIDVASPASMAAGAAVIPINGLAYQGSTATTAVAAGQPVIKTGAGAVPFANAAVKSYAIETAIEEGKHVIFLRNALGAGTSTVSNVAQPSIDLSITGAWATLGAAANIPAGFLPVNPYINDIYFLIGAYVFEDVGVSAYHGAAPLISQTTVGKTNLLAAGGILAVEAYHAGIVRTTINSLDPDGSKGYVDLTQRISTLRAGLANAVVASPNPNGGFDPNPDDYGLSGGTTPYSLAGGANVMGTRIIDADPTNVIAFARTTTQVLNIVTGGGAAKPNTAATGVFFPQGLNGAIA